VGQKVGGQKVAILSHTAANFGVGTLWVLKISMFPYIRQKWGFVGQS